MKEEKNPSEGRDCSSGSVSHSSNVDSSENELEFGEKKVQNRVKE